MLNVAKTLDSQIMHLETKCQDRELSYHQMIALLVEWGKIASDLKSQADGVEQDLFIKNAAQLSNILTLLITQIGFSEDYNPLPETILQKTQNQKFDLLEADSLAALVYCFHKTIEGLAIIAAKR